MVMNNDEDLQEKEGAGAYKRFEGCVTISIAGFFLTMTREKAGQCS
jgi:hypothetical protein